MNSEGRKLLDATRGFAQAVGSDASRYFNVPELLNNRALAEHLQTSIERQISADFLPGFRFKDINRFVWHMKNESFARRYLFGDQIPTRRFTSHWIRRFLVPSKYHYLSEVAHALHARGNERKSFLREELHAAVLDSWTDLMDEWMKIEDCDRGHDASRRPGRTWYEQHDSPPHSRTYYAWSNKAASRRIERQAGDQYNGWYISSILYVGGQLEDVDSAHESVGMTDTGYLESWKWAPLDDTPSPRRTKLVFMFPAACDTWQPPERKSRPSFF